MGMFLKILLYPFSLAYGLVTGLRNHMYNRGLKPVASFDLPVIAVGNLTIGGTGKTPMVEYLIGLLKTVVSLGYGADSQIRQAIGYPLQPDDSQRQVMP